MTRSAEPWLWKDPLAWRQEGPKTNRNAFEGDVAWISDGEPATLAEGSAVFLVTSRQMRAYVTATSSAFLSSAPYR
jgi:hypothetical protein